MPGKGFSGLETVTLASVTAMSSLIDFPPDPIKEPVRELVNKNLIARRLVLLGEDIFLGVENFEKSCEDQQDIEREGNGSESQKTRIKKNYKILPKVEHGTGKFTEKQRVGLGRGFFGLSLNAHKGMVDFGFGCDL